MVLFARGTSDVLGGYGRTRSSVFSAADGGQMRTFPATAAARRPPGLSYGLDAVLLVY